MKTKCIVFDKDGTLLDFDSFWTKILEVTCKNIMKKLGIPRELGDELCSALGVEEGTANIDGVFCRGDYEGMMKACVEVMSAHGAEVPMENASEIFYHELRDNFGVGKTVANCHDLRGFLTSLKRDGIRVSLATSDDGESTEICLDNLGVADCFDDIFTYEVRPGKPDPYYIDRICAENGFTKDEVVMVGDTMTDMEFAKNAGVRAIGVAKNEVNRRILSPLAVAVVDDLRDIMKYID